MAFGYLCRRCKFLYIYIYIYIYEVTSNDLLPSLPPEIEHNSVACAYTDLDKAYGEQLSYMVDSCTFKHTIMAKVMLDPASL